MNVLRIMKIIYLVVAIGCGLSSFACFFAWALARYTGHPTGMVLFWGVFNLVFFLANWALYEFFKKLDGQKN